MNNDVTQTRDKTPAETPETTTGGRVYRPVTDIVETDEGVTLMLDMPGVAAGDVDVTLEKRVLTIRGKVRATNPATLQLAYAEYGEGDFERRVGRKRGAERDVAAGGRGATEEDCGDGVLTGCPSAGQRRRKMQIKDLIPWARKDHPPGSKSDDQNPIATLQNDMNRVFESFWNRVGDLDWPWGSGEAKSDVVETEGTVEVSIELPGMEMKDIEVSVTDDMLTVKGEKKVERQEEKKGYYLSERSYGAIYRTIPLPPGVDGEKAEASFRNGVLTISLPQTPEAQAKVKRIEVRGA